ncbi:hypothetical protein [Bradyrhizobium sp. STM 3843]|uniref:hypothetical protein n=1 Tax=Bradyrhizobium sp. STM 3843 TaxID=551947 RepID=UPI0011128AB5|nr:hypothetical protein [Bradyrhizobium sp. STM 3843]
MLTASREDIKSATESDRYILIVAILARQPDLRKSRRYVHFSARACIRGYIAIAGTSGPRATQSTEFPNQVDPGSIPI